MTKTLDQLHKEMNEYNKMMKPLWNQEKVKNKARDLPNALRIKYAPNLSYLQKKELEEAEKDAEEQDQIYRDMRRFTKDVEGPSIDLIRDIKNWVIAEVSSDIELKKMEESVYKAFAKAFDEYSEYKDAVSQKTDKVIQEIKPSNFRYMTHESFFFDKEFKLGDKMPVIHTDRGRVMGASGFTKELYFGTNTWDKVNKYRGKKNLFKKRPLWKQVLSSEIITDKK